MNTTELFADRIDRLQRNALILGAVGLALCAIGFIGDPKGFYHSYLFAYIFWVGVTAGSLALLMLHHVVGGGWGFITRRFLETSSRLLLPMLILFVPIIIGMHNLYPWSRPDALSDPVIREKASFLNVPFFIIRTVIYFGIWMAFAHFILKWSKSLDERRDPQIFNKLNVISPFGLILFCLTVTFVGVDWILSITPNYYSTIVGFLYVAAFGLSALSVTLILLNYFTADLPIAEDLPNQYLRDLGNLLLAFVMLWAYMSFSQYLINFNGNSKPEAGWYGMRATGGWGIISLTLIPAHFALPFIVLIVGSGIKRSPKRMARVAGYLILMRFMDLYWWVTPPFHSHLTIGFADIGAPLLLGGIWLWLWTGQFRGKTLVPEYDLRLEDYPLPEEAHHG
jgi:hypothetical protein